MLRPVQFQRALATFATEQGSGFGDARGLIGHFAIIPQALVVVKLGHAFVRYSQGQLSTDTFPELRPFWTFLAIVILTAWVWRLLKGDY